MEINSLMSCFWWGQRERENNCLVELEKMEISKGNGGMGFCDLLCFNKKTIGETSLGDVEFPG